MSNGTNRVTLFGNLGADPEFRITQSGQMILRLRIATNDAYRDKENKLIERTDWHDVVVFGSRAEPLARMLTKGEPLFVYGSIRYSSYEKDGVSRTRTEIMARDIGLSGRGKRPLLASSAVPMTLSEPSEPTDTADTAEQPYGVAAAPVEPAQPIEVARPIEPVRPIDEAAGPVDFPKKRKRPEMNAPAPA